MIPIPCNLHFLIRRIGFRSIARIKAAPVYSDKPTFARFQAVSGEDHASGRLEQGKWPSPRAKGDRSWRSVAPQR
jgi:hypothetical protein